MADKVIYNNSLINHSIKQSKSERLIDALKSFFRLETGEDVLELDANLISCDEVLSLHKKVPIILLKGLYNTKETKRKWIDLSNDQNVLVTIDLFYFGILIHREGQRKENFKLRFPFGKY